MIEAKMNPEQPDLSSIVKVDQGSGVVAKVDLRGVSGLFDGIRDYNSEFSSGRMAARYLINDLLGQMSGETDGTDCLLVPENDSREISEMCLSLNNGEVLGQIGLSLESVSGKKSVLVCEGKIIGEGEMRLNLVDGGRFMSFLNGLSSKQVDEFGLKADFGDLSRILTEQLLDQYDLSNPSDEALELLINLDGLVSQYKRLGLGESVMKLETYTLHMKRGDLREFLMIDKKRLFTKPGEGFGPGDWQRDASPEFLLQRWSEALDILGKIKDTPKAEKTRGELMDHLRGCLSLAMKNIPSLDYYSGERKAELTEILERVNARLELEG